MGPYRECCGSCVGEGGGLRWLAGLAWVCSCGSGLVRRVEISWRWGGDRDRLMNKCDVILCERVVGRWGIQSSGMSDWEVYVVVY